MYKVLIDDRNVIFLLQGNVIGQYVIALPDGRIQTTSYTADHVNGYIAEVTYQGTAVYPKETKPYSAN